MARLETGLLTLDTNNHLNCCKIWLKFEANFEEKHKPESVTKVQFSH